MSVKSRGCSGLAYSLEYVSQRQKYDEVVQQDGELVGPNAHAFFVGVTILIDSKALLSIMGSEMDYVEDETSSQFVFHNPNVKETCGCGLSFRT